MFSTNVLIAFLLGTIFQVCAKPYSPCDCYLHIKSANSYLVYKRFIQQYPANEFCCSAGYMSDTCRDRCFKRINEYIESNYKSLCIELDKYYTINNQDLRVIVESHITSEHCDIFGCKRRNGNQINDLRTINCHVKVSKCDCAYNLFFDKKHIFRRQLDQINLGSDLSIGNQEQIQDLCRKSCDKTINDYIDKNKDSICNDEIPLKFIEEELRVEMDASITFISAYDGIVIKNMNEYSTKLSCYKCSCEVKYQRTTPANPFPNIRIASYYPNSKAYFYYNHDDCFNSCQNHTMKTVGSTGQEVMNSVCLELSPVEPVSKNGYSMWYEVVYENKEYSINFANNVCCRSQCKCNIIDYQNNNIKDIKTPIRDRGHICNTHLKDCMIDCRNEAAIYFENNDIVNSPETTPDLNIFNWPHLDTVAASYICKQIGETPSYGVPIYLEYNAGENEYPFREKLFLGNICCLRVRPTIVTPIDCSEMKKNDIEN